jgi:hypothetical protein
LKSLQIRLTKILSMLNLYNFEEKKINREKK